METLLRMPQVGDLVIYQVAETDSDAVKNNHADELPAIVVAVWSERSVNLKVFTDGPVDAWLTSIESGNEPGQWRFH